MRPIFQLTFLLLAVLLLSKTRSFAPVVTPARIPPSSTLLHAHAAQHPHDNDRYWLKDFSIASGEIIDPYKILKLPRSANASQIRHSYITESKKFHPDGARHRKLLPGSCNNWEEVREQWERIKLSYEILKNPQMRKKYDRHEALSDPGRAVRRAAAEAAVNSAIHLGKSLWNMGRDLLKQAS